MDIISVASAGVTLWLAMFTTAFQMKWVAEIEKRIGGFLSSSSSDLLRLEQVECSSLPEYLTE